MCKQLKQVGLINFFSNVANVHSCALVPHGWVTTFKPYTPLLHRLLLSLLKVKRMHAGKAIINDIFAL
jgi:hypothetical protein